MTFYDTVQEFSSAQALEYIDAWKQSTPDNLSGICGPIGPTEQLPIVALMVNALGLDLARHDAHFWGMNEWLENDRPVPVSHPHSFAKRDNQMCFDRILPDFAIPEVNKHFSSVDLEAYSAGYDSVRCVVMQGGQGEIKHKAFNDPLPRTGESADTPPSAAQHRALGTRIVKLHPVTIVQNARTSGEPPPVAIR